MPIIIEDSSTGSNSDETESIPIISDVSDSSSNPPCSKRRRALSHRKSKPRVCGDQATETIDDRLLQKAIDVMEKSDEFDIFGQFVASEMRQILNHQMRKVAKLEIMKILLHYSAQDDSPVSSGSVSYTNEFYVVE